MEQKAYVSDKSLVAIAVGFQCISWRQPKAKWHAYVCVGRRGGGRFSIACPFVSLCNSLEFAPLFFVLWPCPASWDNHRSYRHKEKRGGEPPSPSVNVSDSLNLPTTWLRPFITKWAKYVGANVWLSHVTDTLLSFCGSHTKFNGTHAQCKRVIYTFDLGTKIEKSPHTDFHGVIAWQLKRKTERGTSSSKLKPSWGTGWISAPLFPVKLWKFLYLRAHKMTMTLCHPPPTSSHPDLVPEPEATGTFCEHLISFGKHKQWLSPYTPLLAKRLNHWKQKVWLMPGCPSGLVHFCHCRIYVTFSTSAPFLGYRQQRRVENVAAIITHLHEPECLPESPGSCHNRFIMSHLGNQTSHGSCILTENVDRDKY